MRAQTLDIGEVAKRAGIPPSTLRFYEERGFIRSTGRRGLRRLFDVDVLEHLQFIALGKLAGFSLKELGEMFGAQGQFRIDRKKLLAKAAEMKKTIRKLEAIHDGLQHAARCRAPSHSECPKFRQLLRYASSARAKQKS